MGQSAEVGSEFRDSDRGYCGLADRERKRERASESERERESEREPWPYRERAREREPASERQRERQREGTVALPRESESEKERKRDGTVALPMPASWMMSPARPIVRSTLPVPCHPTSPQRRIKSQWTPLGKLQGGLFRFPDFLARGPFRYFGTRWSGPPCQSPAIPPALSVG